jgi:uncharacterized secreted protein with C-terminal beta-propeller domain
MKYIVETFPNFREIHVVEAENEEIAKEIAQNSDYNMSKHLGTQVAAIYDYTNDHRERFSKEDEYFWDGVKGVDEEGYLTYQRPGGEPVRSDMGEKIISAKVTNNA